MPTQHHSDELFEFSYKLFKFEYKIIKLVFLALSLYGLYQFVNQHVHISIGSPSVASESKQAPQSSALDHR